MSELDFDTFKFLALYYLIITDVSFDNQIQKYRQRIFGLCNYGKINISKLIYNLETESKYNIPTKNTYEYLLDNKLLLKAFTIEKEFLMISPQGKSAVELYIKKNTGKLSWVKEMFSYIKKILKAGIF